MEVNGGAKLKVEGAVSGRKTTPSIAPSCLLTFKFCLARRGAMKKPSLSPPLLLLK